MNVDSYIITKYQVPDDAVALTNPEACKELMALLSHSQTDACPYCNKLPCKSWTGVGWVRSHHDRDNQ